MRTTKIFTTFSAAAVLALGAAAPAVASTPAPAKWQEQCGHLGESCGATAHTASHAKAHHAKKHHARKHHAKAHHHAHKSSRTPRAHIALGYTGR